MKAVYKKEYIKEKCLERISMLEMQYSKIDFKEVDRLEKEKTDLIEIYSRSSNDAYRKHQEKYNKAYSKAMAIDYDEQQAHNDASKSGYSTGSFYPTTIYPTWKPYDDVGASVMLDLDIMLLNGRKDSIRNNANATMSKIKKLERFVSICEDDELTEITLDDNEIGLIFCGG